jgi:hypothetical protein
VAAIASHIRIDQRGVAWIDDTNIKVIEIAMDLRAHGWSAEEIPTSTTAASRWRKSTPR